MVSHGPAAVAPEHSRLGLGRTPAVVSEVAPWSLVKVDLCEPQYLLSIDMVDVDTHIGHQFRCDIPAMLLDVRNPVVRCVRLALAMTEDEDCPGECEFIGDFFPVCSAVRFVGPRWISSFVMDLVEPTLRVESGNVLGSLPRCRVSDLNVSIAEGNDSDHILTADDL